MSKTRTPFKQALLDAVLEEFADIPDSEDEIDVTFSPAFLEKSQRLIRNTERKSWRYVNTAVKRAVWIAILTALLVTTAMAIPAVREAIIRFFVHDEGTHYEFSFDPEQAANAPDEIRTVYLPSYIPEGYQEAYATISAPAVAVGWSNENHEWITYDQMRMPDDLENTNWYGINSEGVTKQTLYLGDYEVLCIRDKEIRTFIWTDHAYFYDLICPYTVSDEEMQRIFYSIQEDADALTDGAE